MIEKLADILEEIRDKALPELDRYSADLQHGPLIGDMYEGLTGDILSKSLFKGLNLKVVTGKIRGVDGQLSDQIDCMLVEGDGEKIPFTDKFIYEFTKVIAVIEVKKNLYGGELEDAFDNLRSVYNIRDINSFFDQRLFEHAFRAVSNHPTPTRDKMNQLPQNLQALYHYLTMDVLMPARIIVGYYGYSSERTLRQALNDLLEKKLNTPSKGYSPLGLPSLIICRKYSLVKLNGVPFAIHIQKGGSEDWTPVYGSYGQYPFRILLEVLWTRLAYRYQLGSSMFGEDLQLENIKLLLEAKAVYSNGLPIGWEYLYHQSQVRQEDEPNFEDWAPHILDESEFIIVNQLCNGRTIRIGDEYLVDLLKDTCYSVNSLVENLKMKNLVSVVDSELRLLTEECVVAVVPNLGYVAGENISGRFSRRLSNYMENNRKEQES